MTLKNLSIITEKTIQIFNFWIVSRWRSVICILIFSMIILSGQNSTYSQELIPLTGVDYKQVNLSEQIKPGQVFLLYTKEPTGPPTINHIFTLEDILSGRAGIDWSLYTANSSYGRFYNVSANLSHFISIIDAKNFYITGTSVTNAELVVKGIQPQLVALGLGTVLQRQQYFNILNSDIVVDPVNFASNLGPWILVGISIFLAIPLLWWVVKRFLK